MTAFRNSGVMVEPYTVEVYRRTDGLWDWRMVAVNGEIVATSGGQGYTERNDAIEAWDKIDAAGFEGSIERSVQGA